MTSPRLRAPSLPLLLALALAGCATTGYHAEPPDVRLAGVRLLDVDWNAQRFRLDFAASNPNAFPLPVRSIEYTVRLAGQRFAAGSATESFTLPPSGDGRFSIEVHTDLIGSASMLSALILREGRREIDYELAGTLGINLPLARPLRFRESGRVSLERP